MFKLLIISLSLLSFNSYSQVRELSCKEYGKEVKINVGGLSDRWNTGYDLDYSDCANLQRNHMGVFRVDRDSFKGYGAEDVCNPILPLNRLLVGFQIVKESGDGSSNAPYFYNIFL